jgi:hypothetical protein
LVLDVVNAFWLFHYACVALLDRSVQSKIIIKKLNDRVNMLETTFFAESILFIWYFFMFINLLVSIFFLTLYFSVFVRDFQLAKLHTENRVLEREVHDLMGRCCEDKVIISLCLTVRSVHVGGWWAKYVS